MIGNLQILIDAPALSLQLLIDGILVGAVFALAAYGLALVWGVTNVINVAQGEFVMLGGFITVFCADQGLPPLIAVPIAATALYVLGWVLFQLVIVHLVGRDMFNSVLATFGIAIVLQQLMAHVFGGADRIVESGLGSWFFLDGLIGIAKVKVVVFAACIALGVTLTLFLARSRAGQAIRATAQEPRAASVLGIETRRVYALTFALNAAICGAAGALAAMAYTIHAYGGLAYTIRSFMIVVVAGLGNLAGVVWAALGLGITENFAGFILGAQYQIAFVFGLLVAVLVFRNWRLKRKRLTLR
ncbi:MAG: branched-chain amino acid ABC transporter permease [Methyloceanibacter sp.]|uniref:branched-chain amino acid ABC transporter permease n=1 Tax=Methyloceanibacter sp. TaxID=1965321 RepID=UPI003D9B1E31